MINIAVTFNKRTNSYVANINNKQFSYSINKYGELAEILANKSLDTEIRYLNLIEEFENYAILKIYNKPSNTVYDVYIDKEDISIIENYKWHINVPQNSRTLYVANDSVGKLHRFILNVTDRSILVDHINRNGLDNRKINLRLTNNSENKKNMDTIRSNTIGCNGISFDGKRYRVHWSENGKFRSKSFSVNKYENALEQAIAYRRLKETENGYLH